MSSIQPKGIQKTIEEAIPSGHLFIRVVKWRDQDPTIVRVIFAGAGLALSGLMGLIDSVASVALAILTSPAYLFGSQIPLNFLARAFVSGMLAGVSLTFAQFENIFADSIDKALNDRFS